MDQFIRKMLGEVDDDLVITGGGVAYQRDMSYRVEVPYFEKCSGYDGSEVADAIYAARLALVGRFVSKHTRVLDIGAGSCEFVRRRPLTWGYDVDRRAATWLKMNGRWSADFGAFSAFCMWDVIEHVEDPDYYIRHMTIGSRLFVTIPIFDDLRRIRESRHYRPGEHLYYWTKSGFMDWVRKYGFVVLDSTSAESDAGRESVMSFALERISGIL